MSTPTQPPYPAIETYNEGPRPSRDSGELLLWTLNGPLIDAVFVKGNAFDNTTQIPYYNSSTDTWHPISKLPITESKVSSITVRVNQLEEVRRLGRQLGINLTEIMRMRATTVSSGKPPYEDGTESRFLMKCCGMDRPIDKDVCIVVKPSIDGEMGFVTVRDYLSTVHPWLMSLREDLLAAIAEMEGEDEPLPNGTGLVVEIPLVEELKIRTREEWMASGGRIPTSAKIRVGL